MKVAGAAQKFTRFFLQFARSVSRGGSRRETAPRYDEPAPVCGETEATARQRHQALRACVQRFHNHSEECQEVLRVCDAVIERELVCIVTLAMAHASSPGNWDLGVPIDDVEILEHA
jgi:hypothetical protein